MLKPPSHLHLQVGAVVLRNELESAADGLLAEIDGVAELGIQSEVGCAFADEFAECDGCKERGADAVVVERPESEGVEQ